MYGYCGNDPVNNIDPTGHWSLPTTTMGWIKAVVSAAAILNPDLALVSMAVNFLPEDNKVKKTDDTKKVTEAAKENKPILDKTQKEQQEKKAQEKQQKKSEAELSPEHQQIIELASQTPVDGDVKEWTTGDLIEWKTSKDDKTLFDFKKQWVEGYGDVIEAAAQRYDLPEYLVAGVAYIEVGGDPLWIDDVAYNVRKVLPTGKGADLTSFGNISMQIRTAAEALGYDPSNLSGAQRKVIINSLKDPKQNIFIAAKHLSDLRNIDFKGVGAKQLTIDQVKVIGTRFNRGGGLSLQSIMKNMSYGEFIVKRKSMLEGLLND